MSADSPMGPRPGQGRALPIDHLRAVAVLLVVAHHTILAYVSYTPSTELPWGSPPMLWRAFPVIDTVKAPALDLLAAFNDSVLMALLFFLAGLFTWRGLARKGAAEFLYGRLLRLGLPFAISAGVLAPLAYYPAYLQHGGERGLGAYFEAWTSLDVWPAGPAWFLWVLLAFSALATAVYRIFPEWGEALGRRLGPLGERPWTFFALWAGASALLYVPLAQLVSPLHWAELGPFTVQTTRIPLYGLYFVFGIALGAHGVEKGLLAPDGRLAKSWGAWQAVAPICLVLMVVCVVIVFMQLEKGTLHPAMSWAASFTFMLSCTASSFMLLSFFLRFGRWTGTLWRSLGRSSFGIYLVHYVFVNWLLLAALEFESPALVKALGVFVLATALSWSTTILLRRIPGVAAVV